ncbi:MAG TPA: oligosaccharide flippase family protein [Dehalococcoidia bacterium]|nr:oligosaccharide flippase family protein [Dehalococcoidia bacterium]
MSEADSIAKTPERFFFNVNLVFVSTLAAYVLSFLAFVFIARVLGPEGRGITSLFQSAVNLGFAFLSLGVPQAAIYFVSRRDFERRQVIEAGLSVTVFATSLTALAVLVAFVFFDDRLARDDLPYWLAVLAMPAIVQLFLLEGVLRGQGRFGANNALDVFIPAITLVGLVAVEVTAGLTVGRSIYTWVLTFLPAVVLGYWLVGKAAWPRRLETGVVLNRMVRFGVQSQLSNLIQLLNYRLDAYLVLLFVNTAGVGFYAVGVSLSEGMWFIANSVAVVLLTNLTAGDEAYAARMTPLVCRNTLLVTALAALPAGAVSPVIVPLVFGGDFDKSVLPFVLLLPGTVALSGSKILAAYVFSRGKPMINAWISLATLVVTVAADLVLIPLLGTPGAACGASIAYGLSLALTATAYRRLSGGSVSAALLPRVDDVSLYVEGARGLLHRLRPPRRLEGSG